MVERLRLLLLDRAIRRADQDLVREREERRVLVGLRGQRAFTSTEALFASSRNARLAWLTSRRCQPAGVGGTWKAITPSR